MKEEDIRKLIKLVEESKIHELEISRWGRKIRIAKYATAPPSPAPPTYPVPASSSDEPETEQPPCLPEESEEEPLHEITSPMPGTFYRASAPDVEPFVEEGDRVTLGQTLCLVEAMKVMNEIESDAEGTITQIMVKNAQPVEYGQPLFLLKPS